MNTIHMALFIEGYNEMNLLTDVEGYPLDFPFWGVWSVLASKKYSPYAIAAVAKLSDNVQAQKELTEMFSSAVLKQSMVGHLLWQVLTEKMRVEASALHEKLVAETGKGVVYPRLEPGKTHEERVEKYFEQWESLLKVSHLISRGRNIPIYFIIQPNQYLKGSKIYSQEELKKYVTNKDIEAKVNHYYPRVRALYAKLARAGEAED